MEPRDEQHCYKWRFLLRGIGHHWFQTVFSIEEMSGKSPACRYQETVSIFQPRGRGKLLSTET
jgi:hypothetical protein